MNNIFLNKIYKILNSEFSSENLSLYEGMSGIALFQALYAVTMGQDGDEEVANKTLNHIITQLSTEENISSTFCSGLSGIGWLLLFLEEIDFLDLQSDDFLSELDSYLNKFLSKFIENDNWDLLHGGLGVAFYFLKRRNYEIVDIFISYLYRKAVIQAEEIKWKIFVPYFDCDVYIFGLAHGNASILSFLVLCCEANLQSTKCEFLLNGLIKFFKNNIQDRETGSYYPTMITCHDYTHKMSQSKSRVAWCHGDLGILYSLYKASIALNDNNMQKDVLQKLVVTAARRSKEDTGVIDFGICHGSAGISLIFNEIYNISGNEDIKAAASYWLNYTIDIINIDKRTFREHLSNEADENLCEYDLLMGLCGVGILLLVSSNQEQFKYSSIKNWKEAFFLI